jgi:hypothetical protein
MSDVTVRPSIFTTPLRITSTLLQHQHISKTTLTSQIVDDARKAVECGVDGVDLVRLFPSSPYSSAHRISGYRNFELPP